MFIFRKILKAQQRPTTLKGKLLNTSTSKEQRKKPQRCQFREIPMHTRHTQDNTIYPIYGDFVFMEHDGSLVTELSLLNQSKLVQDVVISKVRHQQTITVRLSQRIDKELPSCAEFFDHLNNSSGPGILGWGKLLKQFCHTYSKVMQRQSRKKMKSGPRKKFFADVTYKTEEQKQALFDLYPCLHLKFRLKNHHNQLKEIIYSEKFINELGYSSESFVSKVLNEGIPQLMPYNNPLAKDVVKPLIENYFKISENGNEIPDLETDIIYKDNFVRNIRFKTFCFMNYETNTFGIDVVLAITALGEPQIYPHHVPRLKLDPEFIQNMMLKEKEEDYLLSFYSSQETKKTYTEFNKTCLIRELES